MTYEFEDNYQKPKSKIEKAFEELKTAQLSTPRVISQSIKKDLKDEINSFRWLFDYSTFENYKGFLLIRVWEYNKIENKTMEIMRMIPGHNKKLVRNFILKGMGGYCAIWKANGTKSYKWDKSMWNVWLEESYSFAKGLYDKMLCKLSTIKDLVPRYKYCGLQYLDESKNMIADVLCDLLSTYEKHPCVEFLNKFNIPYLAKYKNVIKRLEKGDKTFMKFLVANRELLRKQRIDYFKINTAVKGILDLQSQLMLEQEFNSITEAINTIPKGILNKVIRYLLKIRKEKFKSYYYNVGYKDYINSCYKLGLTSEQIDWMPKDLKEAHDLNYQKIETIKNEGFNKDLKKQANKLIKKIKFETKDLIGIIPDTVEEFAKEGTIQNNCVAKGNYIQDMIRGVCCIMFVRKKEDPKTPYITMELDFKKNQILQARYEHNKTVEIEVLDLLKSSLKNGFAKTSFN